MRDRSSTARRFRYPGALLAAGLLAVATTAALLPAAPARAAAESRSCPNRGTAAAGAVKPVNAMAPQAVKSIPVYIHVINSGPTELLFNPPDSRLRSQIDVLNRAFLKTGFSFVLSGINRTLNVAWTTRTGSGTPADSNEACAPSRRRERAQYLHRGRHSPSANVRWLVDIPIQIPHQSTR